MPPGWKERPQGRGEGRREGEGRRRGRCPAGLRRQAGRARLGRAGGGPACGSGCACCRILVRGRLPTATPSPPAPPGTAALVPEPHPRPGALSTWPRARPRRPHACGALIGLPASCVLPRPITSKEGGATPARPGVRAGTPLTPASGPDAPAGKGAPAPGSRRGRAGPWGWRSAAWGWRLNPPSEAGGGRPQSRDHETEGAPWAPGGAELPARAEWAGPGRQG